MKRAKTDASSPARPRADREAPPPAAYRRGFGRRIAPKLLLLATLILIVDALVGDKGLLERLREHERFRDVSASLDSLKQQNATLRERARRLREEDPSMIESAARRQLGMIKPGEVLFIVKDIDPPASRPPGPVTGGPAQAGARSEPDKR
jgi:cell division protein FtsB